MLRMKETCRVSVRDEAKKPVGKQAATSPKVNKKEVTPVKAKVEVNNDTQKETIDFCEWLSEALLDNIYPGAPFEREVSSDDSRYLIVVGRILYLNNFLSD